MLSRCSLASSRHGLRKAACWPWPAEHAIRTATTLPPLRPRAKFTTEQAKEKYDMRIEILKTQRERARLQAQKAGDLSAQSRIYADFSRLQKEAQETLEEDLLEAQGLGKSYDAAKLALEARRYKSRAKYNLAIRALLMLLALEIGIELVFPDKYKPRNWYRTWTAFNVDDFREFEIVGKQEVSSTASIYTLRPRKPSAFWQACKEAQQNGVWHVDFKQPQIQVVRAYTPLPDLESEDQSLKFLIRHEEKGEVSSWLKRLPLGWTIEMRGPFLEYEIAKYTDRIVFLAGGTGIAPALQAAHALLAPPQSNDTNGKGGKPTVGKPKKIDILWACRRREDCAADVLSRGTATSDTTPNEVITLLNDLQTQYPGQVSVTYFIDEEGTIISKPNIQHALLPGTSGADGRPAQSTSLTSWLPFLRRNTAPSAPPTTPPTPPAHEAPHRSPEEIDTASQPLKTQILISGPEGFIAAIAGPKLWTPAGEEQGALGGMLGKLCAEQPELQTLVDQGQVGVWKI